MVFPFLFRKEIDDEFSQENFNRLADYFKASPLELAQFNFFEITLPAAVTDFKFVHSLAFTPKDVIVMHNLNNVTLTFNWSAFDAQAIYFTTSGATTLRLLVGRYEHGL